LSAEIGRGFDARLACNLARVLDDAWRPRNDHVNDLGRLRREVGHRIDVREADRWQGAGG
jgi:hypothetical protein